MVIILRDYKLFILTRAFFSILGRTISLAPAGIKFYIICNDPVYMSASLRSKFIEFYFAPFTAFQEYLTDNNRNNKLLDDDLSEALGKEVTADVTTSSLVHRWSLRDDAFL